MIIFLHLATNLKKYCINFASIIPLCKIWFSSCIYIFKLHLLIYFLFNLHCSDSFLLTEMRLWKYLLARIGTNRFEIKRHECEARANVSSRGNIEVVAQERPWNEFSLTYTEERKRILTPRARAGMFISARAKFRLRWNQYYCSRRAKFALPTHRWCIMQAHAWPDIWKICGWTICRGMKSLKAINYHKFCSTHSKIINCQNH